jgi:hypothetical protein
MFDFHIPAAVRGRKPKDPKTPPHGLRALLKKRNGYYRETITSGQTKDKPKTSVTVNICVASKYFTHEETGRRRRKRLLYVVSKVRRTPEEIRELYRKRFGIETSYRQMNEAKIKTCTRDPALRLLFVGITLVLRNVWVWIHLGSQFHRSIMILIARGGQCNSIGGIQEDFNLHNWSPLRRDTDGGLPINPPALPGSESKPYPKKTRPALSRASAFPP